MRAGARFLLIFALLVGAVAWTAVACAVQLPSPPAQPAPTAAPTEAEQPAPPATSGPVNLLTATQSAKIGYYVSGWT
jgi:hypothetical protein